MNTDNMNDDNPLTGMNPDNMIQSIDENRFINETTYETVLIGYLPPKESTTKSFTKRQAENVFQVVIGGYNRYSEARQHKVSMLILKLQDLMTVDMSATILVKGLFGVQMSAPTSSALKREPRSCLKPLHETLQHKLSTIYRSRIQNQGVAETVSGHDGQLVVHVKLKRTCQFCTGNHGYNQCNKLDSLNMNAMQYRLSSMTPQITRSLKERIQYTMLVRGAIMTGTLYGTVHSTHQSTNFIIHEAMYRPIKCTSHYCTSNWHCILIFLF